MCTSPILIRDKRYKNILKGRSLLVPCGQCEDCLNRKSNDIFVRAKMEYDSCLKNGGCGFMCCLTYSDDTLPMYKGHMVFNKKDVILFIKRLRVNLTRFYKRHYNIDAPSFKYLVTSEYGTDPTRTHRPHYHLLFFFNQSISPVQFRKCFVQATYCRLSRKKDAPLHRYFGYIFQCDLIDPSRGGIRYSCKYVCKDLTYDKQDSLIRKQICYEKQKLNQIFQIHVFPESDDDYFRNRCIRSRKDYKDYVENNIRPLRHMLQFYMLSNDLGSSCVVDKYGEHLINMPIINFDGFPFALPSIIKSRFEREKGFEFRERLNKSIFLNFLDNALTDLFNQNKISKDERFDLYEFAKVYCVPRGGSILLQHPDIDYLNPYKTASYDDLLNSFRYFDDNNLFDIRQRLVDVLNLYNSEENLFFRHKLVHKKLEEQRLKYEQKKRNKYA